MFGLIHIHLYFSFTCTSLITPMNVRYQTSAGDGFEQSSDDVTEVPSPFDQAPGGDVREAAPGEDGNDLEVRYSRFYECPR
jgi:hypothetical protein